MNRVVITGIAPIAAIGKGKDFFDNLFEKKAVIERIPDIYCKGYEPASKWMVPYPEVDYSEYGRDVMRMSVMASRDACTSVVAAKEALKDAGIEKPDEDTAVVFGSGMPGMREIKTGFNSVQNGENLHPCTIPMIMSNSLSAWIAIALGLHGKNQVVSTACASGTNAVGEAYLHIRDGYGKMALCGGADCFAEDDGLIFRGFDALGALTKSVDGYPRAFSEERSGFLFSEGAACALVLEEYEGAKKRGADIYAEITGYEASCDAYHIVQMPENPEQIMKIISKLASEEDIQYYNAHGTGTLLNDKTEINVLNRVFGEKVKDLYVTSSKGILGHTIAASGALEAAICAYSIKNGIVHGNILGTPMKGILVPETSIGVRIENAISASFGFGGHNAALRFRRAE